MKIQSTKEFKSGRVTALIYGVSGIGKTTLASTLKESTLIISAEGGLLSLGDFDIDSIDITKGDDGEILSAQFKLIYLDKVLGLLESEEYRSKYKNIFIDSLTEIAQITVEECQRQHPDRKNAMVLWGQYSKEMKERIKKFRDLSHYNVIFTALEKVTTDEVSRRFKVPDMSGAIASQVGQYFDEVFHYRIVEEKRVLVTEPIDNALAKDRSGTLQKIEGPDLQNIFNKIKGENNE